MEAVLHELDLSTLMPSFIEHGIDLKILHLLDNADLKENIPRIADRIKIKQYIKIKEGETVSLSRTTSSASTVILSPGSFSL
jgi:hypothetical protein